MTIFTSRFLTEFSHQTGLREAETSLPQSQASTLVENFAPPKNSAQPEVDSCPDAPSGMKLSPRIKDPAPDSLNLAAGTEPDEAVKALLRCLLRGAIPATAADAAAAAVAAAAPRWTGPYTGVYLAGACGTERHRKVCLAMALSLDLSSIPRVPLSLFSRCTSRRM